MQKHVFHSLLFSILMVSIISCGSDGEAQDEVLQKVEIYAGSLRDIIADNAEIEVLARGFVWAEGPVWIAGEEMLLFSDVPANIVYKWTQQDGLSEYLQPAGYTKLAGKLNEGGSNGLLLNEDGELVLCQHGDRRIAIMDALLSAPQPRFRTLASHYESQRFNSPNDAVFHENGDLYFTDPPYGLNGHDSDPDKEIAFSGVYKVDTSGTVTLLIDTLTRPNGIAFSPDHKTMYVAQSDPAKAWWISYSFSNGSLGQSSMLHDATAEAATEQGLPDGLKVHPSGRVFATGPGGVWIFSPSGELLGKIRTAQASANCAFDDDYGHLYITSDSLLLRVALSPVEQ